VTTKTIGATAPSAHGLTRRTVGALALPLTGLGLLLTACAGGAGGADAPFDRQFIDMMVPHHQGAVEMAKIAQQRAQRSEIKQMAEAIVRSQNTEIDQMKAWRKAWYGSDQTPPMSKMPMVPGMGEGGMPGMTGHTAATTMDMAADVEQLRRAPEPFDRAFIEAMIPHHQSAIDAAKAAQTRGQHQELKQLAGAIVTDQQREIEQMRGWRTTWFG
jgi:uncharacterized protein (DUF305 family)